MQPRAVLMLIRWFLEYNSLSWNIKNASHMRRLLLI